MASPNHSMSLPELQQERRQPRSKGEVTAQRILNAAEELFAERGFAGTTLRDVAEQVGIQNPSLYNHYKSKESLYSAVLERGIGPVLAVLTEYVGKTRKRNLDSEFLITRIMEILTAHPHLPRLVQHETLTGGQRLTALLREWIAPAFERAHQMVEDSPSASHWKAEQIPLLVLAMYHVMLGYFTIAPLYKELNGKDLLSQKALREQTNFLIAMTNTLFPEEEASSNNLHPLERGASNSASSKE